MTTPATEMTAPAPTRGALLLRTALVTGSIGLASWLVRRWLERRRTPDLGSVSDAWLASQRGVADDHYLFY